ncbi:MAG: hypothetical protein LBS03_00425 [Bacteroidales bacterium]|jgi:hypothetical protein|nr:hypothetical protein [Bacteroidales bacterium]
MKNQKTVLHKSIFIALAALFASNILAQKAPNEASQRVKVEDFIIFPWGVVPTPDFTKGAWGDMSSPADQMKDLFDCGYNTTGFIPIKYLPSVASSQLAAILLDERIASNPDSVVAYEMQQDQRAMLHRNVTLQQAEAAVKTVLNDIPAKIRKTVYSIYIKDEPNASLFPNLNLWAEAVRKQGLLPYINLFPDYASNEVLGSDGYENHLDEFVNSCHPEYISYDNYSLFGETLHEDRFYGNLESVRKKSLQHGIPFWNVILSNTHYNYAEPSPATLSVQVYSTLAYGGRGIGYFTHYAPKRDDYRLAPVDQFGYRTKTWEWVRNLNLQIHALAPVYCTLKSVNVFHTGNVPKNARGIASAVHLQSIGEGRLLVGEFVDPAGKPYLLIVNKDLKTSVYLNVSFKKKGKIMAISPYGRGKVRIEGIQNWLAPGAGALLTVE